MNVTQSERPSLSLKDVNDSLGESLEILRGSHGKLDYALNGPAPIAIDTPQVSKSEQAIMESIFVKMHEIAKISSGISHLTNRLTGN